MYFPPEFQKSLSNVHYKTKKPQKPPTTTKKKKKKKTHKNKKPKKNPKPKKLHRNFQQEPSAVISI